MCVFYIHVPSKTLYKQIGFTWKPKRPLAQGKLQDPNSHYCTLHRIWHEIHPACTFSQSPELVFFCQTSPCVQSTVLLSLSVYVLPWIFPPQNETSPWWHYISSLLPQFHPLWGIRSIIMKTKTQKINIFIMDVLLQIHFPFYMFMG